MKSEIYEELRQAAEMEFPNDFRVPSDVEGFRHYIHFALREGYERGFREAKTQMKMLLNTIHAKLEDLRP